MSERGYDSKLLELSSAFTLEKVFYLIIIFRGLTEILKKLKKSALEGLPLFLGQEIV